MRVSRRAVRQAIAVVVASCMASEFLMCHENIAECCRGWLCEEVMRPRPEGEALLVGKQGGPDGYECHGV